MPNTPHRAPQAYVFPPLSLEGLDAPLFAHLDRAAAEHPRRTAILFHGARISYARLLRLAETGAAVLRQAGLAKGDRVAVMLPNTPQAIITYFAVLKAGGVCVMVNPLYMDFELRHQLADSGARMLVVLDLLWAKHRHLFREAGLTRVFVTRISDGLRFPLNVLYYLKMRREGKRPPLGVDNRTVFPWRALFASRARYSCPDIDPAVDLAVLQYTGGTTGQAKGAMLTHRNLMANVRQCRTVLREVGISAEVFLGLLPYFHVYGLTVCVNFAVACAATMVPIARFIPAQTIKIIAKTRPTIFPGAPAIYAALLRQPEAATATLGSIRYCVSGSAPMPGELYERFTAMTGAKILEGYGLTEASPITHVNPLEALRKPGSIGLPFPGTEARIVDMETGTMELAPGEQGELAVRGPQVMSGYWNRPQETARTLKDGWLLTGDLAIRDVAGRTTEWKPNVTGILNEVKVSRNVGSVSKRHRRRFDGSHPGGGKEDYNWEKPGYNTSQSRTGERARRKMGKVREAIHGLMITRLIRVSSTIQDRFIRDAGARNLLIRIPPAARPEKFVQLFSGNADIMDGT